MALCPLDAAVAERIGDSESAYLVEVIVRVTGVHRHKRCIRSCLFGVCGSDDIGAGWKAKGKTVAVRVKVEGKTVYEKIHEKQK